MTERQKFVRDWCESVLGLLSKRLSSENEYKTNNSLPHSVLQNVYVEVGGMQKALDPEVYSPGYPRFLLDSWDGYELVDELLKLAYEYDRIRKGAKFRQGLPTAEPTGKD